MLMEGGVVFDEEFQKVVMVEGGYSDHPSDSGGKTKYGITEDVARANGYQGAMVDLPLDVAKGIYRRQYWDLLKLDDVAGVSKAVAHELFDTGVNLGVSKAATFLQVALENLNRRAKDYSDVTVDGVMGPMSVHALRRFFEVRGDRAERVILRALNCQQGSHYLKIGGSSTADDKNEDFMFGWFDTRVLL